MRARTVSQGIMCAKLDDLGSFRPSFIIFNFPCNPFKKSHRTFFLKQQSLSNHDRFILSEDPAASENLKFCVWNLRRY